MNDSILITIKKMLGMDATYTAFDTDVIVAINSALMVLGQLGVCDAGFMITGVDETWAAMLKDSSMLESAKLYMYLKVKVAFDPPSSSFVLASFENQITEMEWRLNVQAESVVNQNE